jgi:hypothetical protein
MIDFSNVSDRELLDKLDKAAIAERLAESVEWSLVREASKRVAEKAQMEMLDVDPMENPGRVQELQILVKVLRNLIPGIVNGLQQEGRLAFFEAKERDLNEVS